MLTLIMTNIRQDDDTNIETRLASLRVLLAIAERGESGEPSAINGGWGVAEHTGYAAAIRDAISIVELGR